MLTNIIMCMYVCIVLQLASPNKTKNIINDYLEIICRKKSVKEIQIKKTPTISISTDYVCRKMAIL